jgi:hypothetical protein
MGYRTQLLTESSYKNKNPLSSSPVRISGFHPDDPGSNPGNGIFFFNHRTLVSRAPIFPVSSCLNPDRPSPITDRTGHAAPL